jgi:hypothetical protein
LHENEVAGREPAGNLPVGLARSAARLTFGGLGARNDADGITLMIQGNGRKAFTIVALVDCSVWVE